MAVDLNTVNNNNIYYTLLDVNFYLICPPFVRSDGFKLHFVHISLSVSVSNQNLESHIFANLQGPEGNKSKMSVFYWSPVAPGGEGVN